MADWPKWRGPGGDGSWEPSGVPETPWKLEPELLWSAPIGGGYGGVTGVGNRVFLMDRQADKPGDPEGSERVLCHDAASGALLWSSDWLASYGKMSYANGPRASVTIHDGDAFALGAAGMALCLDAATGETRWKRDMVAELGAVVPTWGFSASPVIDGAHVLLHVGAPHGSVVALDRKTGELAWKGGDDPAGYCTPEIIEHAGVRHLIVWGPENIASLDPANGRVRWTHPYKITYGVSIAQPLFFQDTLVVSGYWHGSKGLRLAPSGDAVTLVWEDEKTMCGLMSAPLLRDGVMYLLDKSTGLQAVDPLTGRILWSDDNTLTPKDRNPQMSLAWLRRAEGLAALLNANGELLYVRLDAAGFEELGRFQVIGKTWAHPAFTGNRLIARSDTELACWRLWPD
jgi:outer membrane protein assembly factor BamB